MSKLTELSEQLNKKAGINIKESSRDSRTREILNIKMRLERIQNGLNELKGQPCKSPILRESLQNMLDTRSGIKKEGHKGEKSAREGLQESSDYSRNARCNQCGWSGTITIKRGDRIGNADCPECGCGPAVLIRENNSSHRAGVRSGDIKSLVLKEAKSELIDLEEYSENVFLK